MGLKLKVIESIRWLAIAQLTSQLIRIAVSIYVIRQLENEHMAYVALADTLLGFLDMFSTLGLAAVIISKKNLSQRDLSNIAGMLILINFSFTALVFLFADAVAGFYRTPELREVLMVVSLGFLMTGISAAPNALLSKDMRFKELSIVQFVASLAGAVTSLVLVNLEFEYWSIVLGGMAFHVVRTIGFIYLNGGMVAPRFSISESVQHIRFGGFVMITGVVWYVYSSIDVAIAGRYWSPELVGIYVVAVQLTVMPLNRILPMLKRVALPAYAISIDENREKFQHYLAKSLRVSMVLCFSFYFGLAAIATLVVPVILGENWAATAAPLMYLCIAAPFRVYLELFEPPIIAIGKPEHLTLNSIIIAVVMIIAFYVAINAAESPDLLALVWTVVFPVLSIWVSARFCSVMDISFMVIMKALFRPALFSILMFVIVRVFITMMPATLPVVVVLVLAIALGVISFLSLCLLFDRDLVYEITDFVKSRKLD